MTAEQLVKGLAVDIDETLSWTVGRWVELMQEKFGNPENLTAKEMVEKYRYTQHVPYWRGAEVSRWIDEKIHSDEHQKELPLIEDANVYLNKISKIIPISAYITVRPKTVLAGTQHWLDKHGFPNAPIICRPSDIAHSDGNEWKAGMLEKLYPTVLGMIDDNAKLLDHLNKGYPGTIFLYDHMNIDSPLNVIACPHWLNVYEEIRKKYAERGK